MASDWIMKTQSIVFTRIKTQFSEKIKNKNKITDKNFSTVDSQNKKAVFPFVYVNLLPAVEQGMDLEGKDINGGLFTFQIDVYDNQSQTKAKEVMSEIVHIMKTMRFEITEMPSFENDNNTYRMTARFRRIIGFLDIL